MAGRLKLKSLHIRVPEDLYERLLKRLDTDRKGRPLANLSDAVREALERGLKR
jgi:predicted DNA-binding protein